MSEILKSLGDTNTVLSYLKGGELTSRIPEVLVGQGRWSCKDSDFSFEEKDVYAVVARLFEENKSATEAKFMRYQAFVIALDKNGVPVEKEFVSKSDNCSEFFSEIKNFIRMTTGKEITKEWKIPGTL